MACGRTGNCSSCAGSNCSGGCRGGCNGCRGGCTGGCSGCSGTCTSGCRGNCSGSCSGGCGGGCGGTCKDSCSGGCSGCSGSCSGSCSGCKGGCGGTCSSCAGDGCSGSCGSGCQIACGGNCTGACNKTCNGGVQDTNLANLNLDQYFKANNIQNISNFVKFEVENRRGKDATELTFSVGEALDDAKIKTIISNLSLAGQTVTTTPNVGQIGYKSLGLDIIAKAKAAYNTVVPVN